MSVTERKTESQRAVPYPTAVPYLCKGGASSKAGIISIPLDNAPTDIPIGGEASTRRYDARIISSYDMMAIENHYEVNKKLRIPGQTGSTCINDNICKYQCICIPVNI